MKSKRAKAASISVFTKQKVWERDGGCCIFCGRAVERTYASAHYIPRSKGGLGDEKNIVTACFDCHRRMDQTTDRPKYLEKAREHLKSRYRYWNENDLIYRKWDWGSHGEEKFSH